MTLTSLMDRPHRQRHPPKRTRNTEKWIDKTDIAGTAGTDWDEIHDEQKQTVNQRAKLWRTGTRVAKQAYPRQPTVTLRAYPWASCSGTGITHIERDLDKCAIQELETQMADPRETPCNSDGTMNSSINTSTKTELTAAITAHTETHQEQPGRGGNAGRIAQAWLNVRGGLRIFSV